MNVQFPLLEVLLISILAGSAFAAEPARIEWLTANCVTQEPAVGYAEVPVALAFVNAGGEPFAIRKIRTTCGCTKATMPGQLSYAPGETGVVSVVFPMLSIMGTPDTYTVFIEAKHQIMPLGQWTRVIGPCPGIDVSPRVVDFTAGNQLTQTIGVIVKPAFLPACVTVDADPVMIEGAALPPVIGGALLPYGNGATNILSLWPTANRPPRRTVASLRIGIGGNSKLVYAILPPLTNAECAATP